MDASSARLPARRSIGWARLLLLTSMLLVVLVGSGGEPVHLVASRPPLKPDADYFVADADLVPCSDSWSGASPQTPWCDLQPVDGRRLLPGDRILMQCGGSWDQPSARRDRPLVTLSGAGTESRPIVLGAYDGGVRVEDCRHRPRIRGAGDGAQLVVIHDPDHWRVEALDLSNGAVGLRIRFATSGHQGVVVQHLSVHDFRGIYRGDCERYPNVYTALGILFDHSADLLPRSPRAILSDIEVADVDGFHNQGSLGLSGYGCAAVSTESSNLYQRVLLRGLHFHDDAGPAPACSDGLQVVSASDVRVVDSRFEGEGGCMTTSGTTGVILGQVDGVRFVNDVFSRTPDTGSPDQTGVDLENFTRRVEILGSYVGGNAGSGLEVLTINGSENYHRDLNVEGDFFTQNSASPFPGTGETGHIWRGGTGVEPTGSISHNLYSPEVDFIGGALPEVQVTENLAVVGGSHAAVGFGAAPWSAERTADGRAWGPIAGDAGAAVSRFDSTSEPCSTCAVARVWTAGADGVVSIRGFAVRADAAPLEGASAAVVLDERVLLGRVEVGDEAVRTFVDQVRVRRGDRIRFEVRTPEGGSVSWAPTVAYTG